MQFSSISFIFYFLPPVLLLYFLVPFKFPIFKKKTAKRSDLDTKNITENNEEYIYFEAKNLVLFLASIVFCFYVEPIFALIMVLSALSCYIHGLLIGALRGKVGAKIFLLTGILSSLAVLSVFKYTDFVITNINAIFSSEFDILGLLLPVGISYYTFQAISYLADVYTGKLQAEKRFVRIALFLTFFAKLTAGPIVRYTTIEKEMGERKPNFEDISSGVTRFVLGLGKKVLIADVMGSFISAFAASGDKSVVFYWLYAIAISLRLYFDFSGYSDMAIGLGRIFGFHFLENFDYPFISKSAGEFWRRWHISLGSWFRDYIYIPLGGNRVSIPRWLLNTLAVWAATGIWHGADWTFIIWGLFFAIFLTLEKFVLNKFFAKIPKVFSYIYVIFLVLVSFVIFSANGMSGVLTDLGGMFGFGGLPFWTAETGYYLSGYAILLVCAIIGSTPLLKSLVLKLKKNEIANRVLNILEPILLVVILFLATAYFVDGSFSGALYGGF